MEREALGRHIKRFMRENGITQKALAEEMQLHQGLISEMISGKRKMDRLLEYLRENYGYVMADDEVRLVEEHDVKHYTTNSNGVRFYEQDDGKMLMQVPVVKYNALGSLADDFTPLYEDRDEEELVYFDADKVYHGKYIAFKVDGDSMDDGTRKSFQRGDVILVRELDKQDWLPKLHISEWPYWVVCWGNCIRLKQILEQDGTTLTLHSLNPSPEYTDFQLDLSSIYRLFNVIEVKPQTWKAKNL